MNCKVKNKIINTAFLVGFLLLSKFSFSQQNLLISQHLFNKLNMNPGYAGTSEGVSGIAMYRNQWNGIKGSPTQYLVSIHSPIATSNHNVGGVFNLDRIGNINKYNIYGNYAYAFKIDDNKSFRIGLRGGVDYINTDNTQLDGYGNSDPNFIENIANTVKPVFGAGMYYESQTFALTASVPNMLVNSIDLFKEQGKTIRNLEMFLGGEFLIPLSSDFKLKPATFIHISDGAPVNVDLNSYVIYKDILWLGAGYRTSKTFVVGGQFVLNKNTIKTLTHNIRIGYSYDFSNAAYSAVTNGSHELFIGFDLFKPVQGLRYNTISPRYF